MLRLPLKHIFVTQPFGVNFLNFYQQWGLKGHNGQDFRANDGCPLYAAHSGIATFVGQDNDGGKYIEIKNTELGIKTIYYHLKGFEITSGSDVEEGQFIGECDNTGTYSVGNHLHFGFKRIDKNGNTLNHNNGYAGCIEPVFTHTYNGIEINPKDWDRSRSYHRYYRGRPKGGYFNELRIVPILTRYLGRLPRNEEINACVYGGWDRETVKNPALYTIWSQLKKSEFLAGERSFQ